MSQFEYLVSDLYLFGHEDFSTGWQEFMNERGREGWELICTTHRTVPWDDHSVPGDHYGLIFKRPKP
jgi:hypothetical protein